MATNEVRRYWTRVAELGCVVCKGPAEIAHAHGGSLRDIGIYRAKGRKPSDWLVLPLCPSHHRWAPLGLDLSVAAWESRFGTLVEHLDAIAKTLGVPVWEKAGETVNRRKLDEVKCT